MTNKVTNVVVAGLGGQGVLKASDILGEAVFLSGLDIKKAEIHGMSQRGGSVNSDVRFGERVDSPMVPDGLTDYLVVLSEDQIDNNIHRLREGGVLIVPENIDKKSLSNPKSLNVALLGVLSSHLAIEEKFWMEAIYANLPEKIHEVNKAAFALGRESA